MSSNEKKLLPSRLRSLRGSRTQAEIAAVLGMKQPMWARYEQGITTPGADVLIHICTTCGISSDWLLGLTDQETKNARAEQKLEGLKKAITELLKEY